MREDLKKYIENICNNYLRYNYIDFILEFKKYSNYDNPKTIKNLCDEIARNVLFLLNYKNNFIEIMAEYFILKIKTSHVNYGEYLIFLYYNDKNFISLIKNEVEKIKKSQLPIEEKKDDIKSVIKIESKSRFLMLEKE